MGGGSGGSSWTPSDAGNEKPQGEDGGFHCSDVSITTRLQSPDPDILDSVSVGDVLTVQFGNSDENEDAPPPLVATKDGNYVGTISHYDYQNLVNCVEDGHEYIAEVRRVDGGLCQVTITHS